MERQPLIDAAGFWKLLAVRPVAVPVVAARDGDGPAGLLALSATHVSAAPPTMLVAIAKDTSALKAVTASSAFAISYLPEGAAEIADIFGGRRGLSGADRFAHGQWTSLVVGRIVESGLDMRNRPLIFASGRYAALRTETIPRKGEASSDR
jgi:flavin reductase (DIM6/NTAB) family NADH-FMN oxidoreductase RutF